LVDGYVGYGGIFEEIRTFATFKCFEIGDSIITTFLAVERLAVVDGFIVMAFWVSNVFSICFLSCLRSWIRLLRCVLAVLYLVIITQEGVSSSFVIFSFAHLLPEVSSLRRCLPFSTSENQNFLKLGPDFEALGIVEPLDIVSSFMNTLMGLGGSSLVNQRLGLACCVGL
jgi:hypothetical protein